MFGLVLRLLRSLRRTAADVTVGHSGVLSARQFPKPHTKPYKRVFILGPLKVEKRTKLMP